MTIVEVKAEYVFTTIQKLDATQKLVACDFKRGALRDTSGMMIEYVARLISEGTTKFFKVEE
ncbi:MAG: hypothetical protein ACTTKS_02485 [Bulleidia sp.]